MGFKIFWELDNKFKNFINRHIELEIYQIDEYEVYKRIPKTNNSYAIHTPHTTADSDQKHAHIYAMQNGKGGQVYSVNIDGTGHDGSTGIQVPKKHAKHLINLGFDLNDDLIIESYYYEGIVIESAIGLKTLKFIVIIE